MALDSGKDAILCSWNFDYGLSNQPNQLLIYLNIKKFIKLDHVIDIYIGKTMLQSNCTAWSLTHHYFVHLKLIFRRFPFWRLDL